MGCIIDPRLSIATQLRRLLFVFGFGMLLFFSVLAVIGIWTTGKIIADDSRSMLLDQAITNATIQVQSKATLFSNQLLGAANGFMLASGYAFSDASRNGYNVVPLTSYYDNPSTLKPPLIADSRRGHAVSLSASSYYVPGSDVNDVGTFSSRIEKTLDLTSYMDLFAIPTYPFYSNMFSGYVGDELDGVFRQYPGVGTFSTDPNSFDARVRDWYMKAKNEPNKLQFSNPYRDFTTDEWMMTVSKAIYNVSDSNQFLGVAGADLLISSLNEIVSQIRVYQTGKISLFQADGIVVADREWDLTSSSTSGLTYSDLNEPKITSDLWQKIRSLSMGETDSYSYSDVGDYQVVCLNPTQFEGQYRIVVFIPTAEINQQIDPTIEDMEKIQLQSTLIVAGILTAVLLFLTIILYCMIKKITQGFKNISNVTRQVLSHFGRGFDDVGTVVTTDQDVTNHLAETMNTTLDRVRHEVATHGEEIANHEIRNRFNVVRDTEPPTDCRVYYPRQAPEARTDRSVSMNEGDLVLEDFTGAEDHEAADNPAAHADV